MRKLSTPLKAQRQYMDPRSVTAGQNVTAKAESPEYTYYPLLPDVVSTRHGGGWGSSVPKGTVPLQANP